jgi:S1-C subfamily serine protease
VPLGKAKPGSVSAVPAASLETIQAIAGGSFVGKQAGESLEKVRPDRVARGAAEAKVYKRHSRSVVLIVTRDGLGSGSLLNNKGEILTNWHVIGNTTDVGVVFKPAVEGKELTKADLVRAKVIKVDEIADLALIRVDKVPAGVEPIALGSMADLTVGADVHAIGHPTGEAWTYTKGVVSQMRQNYPWTTKETRKAHKANVIQTQTPINPGNSGGPLLTSDGKLVGVNSFSSKGEGLNFAVAVDEVRRFVDTTGNRLAENTKTSDSKKSAKGECEVKEVYKGTNKEDTMEVTGIDTDCDGEAEIEIRKPYDIRKPIVIVVDENKDGIPDTIIFDVDRDGKWDYSLRDTNFDGKWDLECEHEDGDLEPTRCIPYRQKK